MSDRPADPTRPSALGARRLFIRLTSFALAWIGGASPAPCHELGDLLQGDWRWVRFDLEDGLPGLDVRQIVETDRGPWVGTGAGLASYDGWRWRPHGPRHGLPAAPVDGLAASPDGEVWVSFGKRLFRGGEGGFEEVPIEDPSLHPNVIGAFGPERDTALVRLLRIDRSGEKERRLALLGRRPVVDDGLSSLLPATRTPITCAASGRAFLLRREGLWVGTRHGWKRWIAWEPAAPRLSFIAESKSGYGLAHVRLPSGARGIWTWSPGERPQPAPLSLSGYPEAGDISEDGDALVLLDSLEVVVGEQGRWRVLDKNPAALEEARMVRFRPNGDLWVAGPDGLWLLHTNLRRWNVWPSSPQAGPSDRVHAIVPAPDGTIWLATGTGVEQRRADGEFVRALRLPEGCRGEATALALEQDGTLWVGSGSRFAGLVRVRGERVEWVRDGADGEPIGAVHALRQGRDGSLWVAEVAASPADDFRSTGAIRRIVAGEVRAWKPASRLSRRRFYDVAEDGRKGVWVASSKGAARWDGTRWQPLPPDPQEPAPSRVTRVLSDEGGGLWLACDSGRILHVFANGALARHAPPRTHASTQIRDLARGTLGTLWVASDEGAFLLHEGRWIRYDTGTGLAHPRVWPLLVQPGRVLLGTLGRGVAELILDPSESPPPRVHLEEPIVERDRVHVRWRAHAFWGELPPSEIEVRHRLDGGPWSGWTTANEFVAENLGWGRHRLEVEAQGGPGATSGPRAVKEFVVERPLSRSPLLWAPLGALALIACGFGAAWGIGRRRAAHVLRESEARLRAIYEHAPVMIHAFGTDGRLELWSPEHERALGWDELSARRDGDVLALLIPDPVARERARTALRDEPGRYHELHVRDRKGHERVQLWAEYRLTGGARIRVGHDITERVRAEEERRAFDARLREAQKLESLGVLAGGIAHDFNNLLAAIRGHAELALEERHDQPDLAHSLSAVIRATERAADLARQMLAYSGRGSFEVRTVELDALVREMAELLEASISKKACLRIDSETSGLVIEADPTQLRQVVMNLITNASDALGDAAGTIQVTLRRVHLSHPLHVAHPPDTTLPPGDYACLEVRDSGSGMRPETLERVFEPFFTTKFTGRGLGMAAVLGILRGHGGGIEVSSRLGQGSSFRVLLPAIAPERQRPPVESAARAPLASVRDARRPTGRDTVLVVDDEEGVREVARLALERAGYRVLLARDGVEALERFERGAGDIDAVLLDLTMPRMGGEEALAALRQLGRDVRIVMTSGFSAQRAFEAQGGSEFDAFLAKPFSPVELVETIADVLRREG